MNVTHSVMASRDANRDDAYQTLNAILEAAGHAGIAQFRVGSISVSILDTAIAVNFSSPLPDNNYEVFLQAQSVVSVSLFPTLKTVNGFTLNLSVGVGTTISYFAVGLV